MTYVPGAADESHATVAMLGGDAPSDERHDRGERYSC
jgi:hypothetical protein